MSEQDYFDPVRLAPPMGGSAEHARRGRGRVSRAVVALLVTCAVALVGYLVWDDSSAHQQRTAEAHRADRLTRQVSALTAEASRLNSELTALRDDNARLRSQASNPTLPMWNSCGGPCTIAPNSVRVGSVPDTFQLQINFTADVPVRTYIFTFRQWAQFDQCGFAVRCVTGSYRAFDAATSFSQTVDEAEGCSAYVWVLQADRQGTIKPDVRVHYQPASQPTGICAVNP
ncbi:MAG TPA: hypothetical protein VKI99_00580 [Candidatus Dormibacteraeota bacterium]|nr:hypothetical protein [Candidatus Dormibacteraeota bacterium]